MGGKAVPSAESSSPRNSFDVEAQKHPSKPKRSSSNSSNSSELPSPGKVVKAPPYTGPKAPPSPAPSWAPSSGKIKVEKTEDGKNLRIYIPAAGFSAAKGGNSSPGFLLAFATLWLAAVITIPFLVVLSGMNVYFALVTVPFIIFGLYVGGLAIRNACLEERLDLTKKQFTLEKILFGWKTVVQGSCSDIVALDLKIQRQFHHCLGIVIRETPPATWCYIIAGNREVTFGHFVTSPEQQHALKEISLFLRVPMGTGTLAPTAFA